MRLHSRTNQKPKTRDHLVKKQNKHQINNQSQITTNKLTNLKKKNETVETIRETSAWRKKGNKNIKLTVKSKKQIPGLSVSEGLTRKHRTGQRHIFHWTNHGKFARLRKMFEDTTRFKSDLQSFTKYVETSLRNQVKQDFYGKFNNWFC